MLTQHYDNILEYSVSEISNSVKLVVESSFSLVKIRGEVSNLKFHQSGHVYFSLKDENAVINAVCFKNIASNLKIRPDEGLEVVAIGKITTYSGRSNYQIIVTDLIVGGTGSLMALFEKRKQELLGKGYFDAKHKKPIPRFPERIYVITSETGAVIQDIIHRIEARYPLHLIIAPVRVQGSGAEIEIANRISQINEITDNKSGPNLIIIARGGGSIEDLWCFNEEIIIQAVFNSYIPIISAIGHETDTTLIDYASDLRAPTPTAAAELATPVRFDLMNLLVDRKARLNRNIQKTLSDPLLQINSLSRILSQGETMLHNKYQKTDDVTDLLYSSIRSKLEILQIKYEGLSSQIRTPKQILISYQDKINNFFRFLNQNSQTLIGANVDKLTYLTPNKQIVFNKISYHRLAVQDLERKLTKALMAKFKSESQNLDNLTKLLASFSYKNVLKRGFALIRDENGSLIKSAAEIKSNKEIEIEFFTDRIRLPNINA
ncbi:MAG: exodeoxyribonuclease VII large subunit [Rickettsiales bacterium]|jgi:exodeoxyribonuclease VII large subunit|nr:exodeoxyribonuclease VII large subunit [Rickettsiales bacterium]